LDTDAVASNAMNLVDGLSHHLPYIYHAWEPRLNYGNLREEVLHCADTESTVRPQHILEAVCKLRTKKLPDVTKIANAGSFFKNLVVNREASTIFINSTQISKHILRLIAIASWPLVG
jgi:UDP-N-acetylenolpyruvoylglucosamine reductase